MYAISCVRYQMFVESYGQSMMVLRKLRQVNSNPFCMVSVLWKPRSAGRHWKFPYDGFAQVNDEGAELLMQCIAEATESSTTLFDLYCGSGAIGIALSDSFASVVGIEIQPEAIERAKKNAKRNNVSGTWMAGKVEDCLPKATGNENSTILLDPPREGLHPKSRKVLCSTKGPKFSLCGLQPKIAGKRPCYFRSRLLENDRLVDGRYVPTNTACGVCW